MSQQGKFNFDGASHGDDIFYLFKDGGFVTPPVEAGTQADKLRNVMCRLWTNFAKCGDPTPPSDSELGFSWKPTVAAERDDFVMDALDLSAESIRMVEGPFRERIQFWRNLFAKYGGDILDMKYLK